MSSTTASGRRTKAALRVVRRVVIALAIVVAIVAIGAAILGLRDRLASNPDEVPWWGYASPGVFGVAWLVFYVGTRLNTRRDESLVPAQGVVGRRQPFIIGAGAFVTLVSFIYSVTLYGGRRGRGGLDERFPELRDAGNRAVVYVVIGCAAIWIAWAVVPPALAFLRRRARAGLVDAVVDLGGPNAVRLLYRPTLSLGGTVTWIVNGETSVPLSPGQAVGLMAPDGPLTMMTGKRTRKSMVVRLELGDGVRTDVVLRRGLFPRVTLRQRAGEVAFVATRRAFASLWVGPGGMSLPVRGDEAMHLWASERPTALPPSEPWWQARWWIPVTAAIGGAVAALGLVAAGQLRESHGLGDQLVAALAVLLAAGALSLDRARRAVGWTPWRAPLVWLLAGVAGGLTWWGAGWLTAIVAVLGGGPLALVLGMARLKAAGVSQVASRSVPGAPLPTTSLPHARIAFWKRQADAVVALSKLAPDRPTSGYVRVVPVTPGFRAGVSVQVAGWNGSMTDCPLGVRLAAGTYPVRVEHERRVAEAHVQVLPGQVTELHVGLVPFGLQFARVRGALSLRVRPPFEAKLVEDHPPEP